MGGRKKQIEDMEKPIIGGIGNQNEN